MLPPPWVEMILICEKRFLAPVATIARRTNEVLAEIVSRHPARFGAIATLPGLDAEGALAETHW